jgi:hypothetical protein
MPSSETRLLATPRVAKAAGAAQASTPLPPFSLAAQSFNASCVLPAKA